MKMRLFSVCVASIIAPTLLAAAATAFGDEKLKQEAVIPVPGGLNSFDISFVDSEIHTYVLADRTNKSIDVVNTKTNTFTKQLLANFEGVCTLPPVPSNVTPSTLCDQASGPNGVIIVDHSEVWAADAPPISNISCTVVSLQQNCTATVGTSSVKVINLNTGAVIATIDTKGKKRADELCEDKVREVVLVANDNPVDNFLTFISSESHKILGTIKLDGKDPNGGGVTANGIEQCEFDTRLNKFLLAVPDIGGGSGAVLVISKSAPFTVEKVYKIDAAKTGCAGPAGLAIGPAHEVQLGCGGINSVIIDDRNGTIITNEGGEGGADEVWYNPGSNHFYIARSGAGQLGVTDAGPPPSQDPDGTTAVGSHSVAADAERNRIYTPANKSATICNFGKVKENGNGCIAVFTAPNDRDDCLAEGKAVIAVNEEGDAEHRKVRCDRD